MEIFKVFWVMETGNIIIALRKEKNCSQKELTNKSDVSREMIGKMNEPEPCLPWKLLKE